MSGSAFFFKTGVNRYLPDFVKQYWAFQSSDGGKTSTSFLLEIRKTLMFSFGEAVILTGMDWCPPEYQSEFWRKKDAESSRTQLEGLHPFGALARSSPRATPCSEHRASSVTPEHICALSTPPPACLWIFCLQHNST